MYFPSVSSVLRHMLQLFHLSVVKVDLDVRCSSQEERASTGAMTASAGKLAAALHRRSRRVMFVLSYAALVGPYRAAPQSMACKPTPSPG